jgi:hypothetical protein
MNSNDLSEYLIKRLDENNISDLEQLYEAVYKKKSPSQYFSKKYDTAYTGISHIGYMAYKGAIPIAFYGVIPCFIQYENRIILSAQSADTMTHPEHRYKNLFFNLANMCFDLCKQNSIDLIYGFPNQNSYHGFIKLGWQMTEMMDCFKIPVYINPFVKALNKINKKHPDSVLKDFIINEDGLKNSVIQDGFAGVYRDENYLRYKTYSNTYVLQIASAKVWVGTKNGLSIGDIYTDKNDFDELIKTIKKIASKLGTSVIYFHACKQTSLHTLFEQNFDSISSFPVLFQNFSENIDIKKIRFTFADIDIF